MNVLLHTQYNFVFHWSFQVVALETINIGINMIMVERCLFERKYADSILVALKLWIATISAITNNQCKTMQRNL